MGFSLRKTLFYALRETVILRTIQQKQREPEILLAKDSGSLCF